MGSSASAPARAIGPLDLSCRDWRERLVTGRSLVPALPQLDQVAAKRAIDCFNLLRLADVPGTPTMGEAGGEWFRDIVGALFGSLCPITRIRRIREVFALIPKKNSKTTDGALLMLVALLLNERPRGKMVMTAPVQEVADLAFAAAAGAIALDPVLDQKLHVREHIKTIIHRETKAELKIITFDPAVLTGQKLVAALIDELHVVAKNSKAPSALRQIRGGMIPFPEAFLAFITTQSEDAPAGVFKSELQNAREIRDGVKPGPTLAVLYEFPPEKQKIAEFWKNPANWPQVTPNLGKSIDLDRLIEGYASAASKGDGELRAWASQHLNVEIGIALTSDAWVGAGFWEACKTTQKSLTLEDLIARCEVITVGIDGGGLDDMLGFCALGRETGTGRWLHWARAWIHPIVLERRKEEAQRFEDFRKDGTLYIVERIGDDVDAIADLCSQLEDSGLLDRIGIDQAAIGQIVNKLTVDEDGPKFAPDRVLGIPQGWRLVTAIKTTERELAARGFEHEGSALMSWVMGNARVEPRGNAVIITKQISGTAKIDPLLATLNAVALMSMNPKARNRDPQLFIIGGR